MAKKTIIDLYEVEYQVTDRKTDWPIKKTEVEVPPGQLLDECLKKQLNKYRYASQLTKSFTVKIVSQRHSGWK